MRLHLYINKTDRLVLGVAAIVYITCTVVGYQYVGDTALLIALLVLLFLSVFILAELYRRMQRRFDEQWEHYYQLEALASIFSLLKIRHPLPATRGWAISPDFLREMIAEIKLHKPKFILDLGSGVSTLIAGYMMEKSGGKVVGIDHDAMYADATRKNISAHSLEVIATVVHAPLTKTSVGAEQKMWYDTNKLEFEEKIDMLIVDGPPERTEKMARYPAVPVLYRQLSKNAVILVDDARGNDLQEAVKQWQESYPDLKVSTAKAEKGMVILRRTS
jgi:predicted O-methyltransferase YrrM